VAEVAVIIGGIAPVPYGAAAVERMLTGRPLTSALIEQAAQAWASEAHPLAGNTWKVEAACAVVRRALDQLAGQEARQR
jgi:xanthine dehydrogenase YagS FAD-binding subunit